MKRKIIIGLISVFALLTIAMVFQFVKTVQEKERAALTIQTLPTFLLIDVNGNKLTNHNITEETWVVFVFFHSECHYCQSEAEQLQTLDLDTQNIQFIWISSEKTEAVKKFQKAYQLHHIPFAVDHQEQLAIEWGVSTTPQFLIYNPKGELFKNHKGALRIDHLISQIHEHKTN